MHETGLWHHVAKAFVDDPDRRGDFVGAPIDAVGIVRVDDDHGVGIGVLEGPAGGDKRSAVFIISWPGNSDGALGQDAR